MRKVLLALALFVLSGLAATAAAAFLFRDAILLREARSRLASALPGHTIRLGGLRTGLFGSPELLLEGLELESAEGLRAKARELRLSSPLSLWRLTAAARAGVEIPLVVSLNGFSLTQPAASAEPAAAEPSPWPTELSLPALFPLPVNAEISLAEGEWSGAGAKAGRIGGQLTLRGNQSGFEAGSKLRLELSPPGASAAVPVALEARLAGTASAVRIVKLSLQAAGIEASGNGELSLKPVSGKLVLSAEVPELSRLSLRAEDRAALGLTGPAAGSLSLRMAAAAGPEGAIAANGLLRLENGSLPLRLPDRSLWAPLLQGTSLEGSVAASAELPFRAVLKWPLRQPAKVTMEKASLALDLSEAAVTKPGMLEKPAGVPLRAELRGSVAPEELTVERLSLQLHTLSFQGSGRLPAPYGSRLDGSFDLKVASLSGFPRLLPTLREEQAGASLADATGLLSAAGRVRLPLAEPARALVELQALSLQGIRLPLAYASASVEAKGVLTGSASGKGSYDAGVLKVAHSTGSFDLGDLALTLKDKLAKKRGRKLRLAFAAKGTAEKLDLSKFSLEAEGLSGSLSGSVSFPSKGVTALQLLANAKAELGPLREYLPALPAKVSAGSLDASLRLGGRWLEAGGIEKSPLTLSGRIAGKLGSVELPEPAPTAAGKPASPPKLPSWPVLRASQLSLRLDLARFRRGALEAENARLSGELRQGTFTADLSVARVLGGKARLERLSGSLLDPAFPLRGGLALEGTDLSLAAAYVDPAYREIVRGTLQANASFSLPSLWADSLLDTVSASGSAQVAKGYLSTASFDGLVNEKLAKVPGLADKAKVKTGGVEAEIRSRFELSQGTLRLSEMTALTPRRDEMRLQGTINLAFDCDLNGQAHLASPPVRGAVLEANSDPQGRLVVPVRFHGNLKSPEATVAASAIEALLANTAAHEARKFQAKAVDSAKTKIEDAAKKAAGGLLDGLFKKK